MLGITDYLWRLIPANPILLRVIETGGKRWRDFAFRCVYLGIMVAVVVFSFFSGTGSTSFADLSNRSAEIFTRMSYLQLSLIALIAPIFTAGAITQEKDSQTYDILLSTPLTNGQIVLGSLLSRLFFVVALLISGIPVFSVTQIFGGVAISAIVTSFAIAAATAFLTGALAMAIATLKVGTRRTIFGFYVVIVLYVVGGLLLDQLSFFKIPLLDPITQTTELSSTSWLTGIHPFLALRTMLFDRDYVPPEITQLPQHLQSWPFGWYLSRPASFFITMSFVISFLLVVPSIIMLRRVAQSTVTIQGWILQKLRVSSGDRTRKPRYVWANPIAWREAKTKASAARAVVIRSAFFLFGLAGAIVLLWLYSSREDVTSAVDARSYDASTGTLIVYTPTTNKPYTVRQGVTNVTLSGKPFTVDRINRKLKADIKSVARDGKTIEDINFEPIPRSLPVDKTRQFLISAVIVEFAIILLIVTNAAASTVTREKEDGTLDLLLSTPITSRYYIWGKLRGLVSYVLPLVGVPAVSVLLFVCYDIIASATGSSDPGAEWLVMPESILIVPATFTIVVAFAAILGMQMSLRCRKTVMAVMSSVGIVVGICGTLGWCGANLVDRSNSMMSAAIASFSPFTVLTLLIDPQSAARSLYDEDWAQARGTIAMSSIAAVLVYGAIVWSMYQSMVKNFDMTIRRQSR